MHNLPGPDSHKNRDENGRYQNANWIFSNKIFTILLAGIFDMALQKEKFQ